MVSKIPTQRKSLVSIGMIINCYAWLKAVVVINKSMNYFLNMSLKIKTLEKSMNLKFSSGTGIESNV